jgi:hypothetical protein
MASACVFCRFGREGEKMVFCGRCGRIQPLPQHAFDAFGLSVSYDVDLGLVRRRYLELQRMVHPDSAPKNDGRACNPLALEGWSAIASRSYRQLCDPLARAKLVVHLRQHPKVAANNGHAFGLENHDGLDDIVEDESFLAEVLDLQERIQEGRSDDEESSRLQAQVRRQYNELLASLGQSLSAGTEDVARAKVCISRLSYIRRLLDLFDGNNKDT